LKRRILFLLHLPPPIHGAAIVGKTIFESESVNSLFNCKFLNLSTSKTIQEIGKSSIIKWIRYCKMIFSFLNLLLFFKPDLVYITLNSKGSGLYKDSVFAIFAKLFRKNVVYHFHNKGVRENQDRAFDHFLYKKIFKDVYVILLSKFLFQDIEKYVPNEKVFYCSNGIQNLLVSNNEFKNRSNQKNDKINILFLSNLIKSKGIFVLLDALNLLKEKSQGFECIIIGGEGDVSINQLSERIEHLGLSEYVKYEGKKYGNERLGYFNSADIFIHPTLNDCFPLVILEAFQFSLPVISTFEGAIPEIVKNNVNGYLVNPNDIKGLADRIEFLFLNPLKIKSIGKANRIKYEKEYTVIDFEERFVAVLNQILSKND
jgi:glycosyltransferase involved in cell wall biosynthesis